jgi:hypothetical protein
MSKVKTYTILATTFSDLNLNDGIYEYEITPVCNNIIGTSYVIPKLKYSKSSSNFYDWWYD